VVVNILADGSIWGQNEEELTTTEAIQDYVDQVRVRNEEKSIPTRLNLRADKNVDTRDIKKVVQAAGEAGVSEVIFGSLAVED
jgi:biopolymer transport protein ExbD